MLTSDNLENDKITLRFLAKSKISFLQGLTRDSTLFILLSGKVGESRNVLSNVNFVYFHENSVITLELVSDNFLMVMRKNYDTGAKF